MSAAAERTEHGGLRACAFHITRVHSEVQRQQYSRKQRTCPCSMLIVRGDQEFGGHTRRRRAPSCAATRRKCTRRRARMSAAHARLTYPLRFACSRRRAPASRPPVRNGTSARVYASDTVRAKRAPAGSPLHSQREHAPPDSLDAHSRLGVRRLLSRMSSCSTNHVPHVRSELSCSAQRLRSAPQARSGRPALILPHFWRQMRRRSSPGDV